VVSRGPEFCGVRSRISHEAWVSDFAGSGGGKVWAGYILARPLFPDGSFQAACFAVTLWAMDV